MSDKPNPILEKSYAFALNIVRLYKHLTEVKHEFVMSKQMLSNGTEVGAYVKSAQEAEAKPVFHQEMSIALRRATRTEYWLQLLSESEFLEEAEFTSVQADCAELIRILSSITKSTRTAM